jgi:hypothetical protein
MMTNALIIFIKNPERGKVKTRLARTLGDDQALEIYEELTRITRENVQALAEKMPPTQAYLFYDDYINYADAWSNEHFQKHRQIGDDLGERMRQAFQTASQNHSHVCIIGSDCPTLSTAILAQAFEQLAAHDFVIGPSTDGGYYLLGINFSKLQAENPDKHPPQYIFEKMTWSTDTVMTETISRLKKRGHSYALLPTLTDIDEEKDWLSYLSSQKDLN